MTQEEEARRILDIKKIVSPPNTIKSLWAALPAEVSSLQANIEPVTFWLDDKCKAGDYVLIHGDFGACYLLAQHCLKTGRVPIYSTTERNAIETKLDDGTIQLTHIFRHVRYRKYGE